MRLRERRELLEGCFLAAGDEGGEDAAGLVTHDGGSVQRASRYEHEGSGAGRYRLVTDEEYELIGET